MIVGALVFGLASPATAEDGGQSWALLEDALLAESVDGDLQTAARAYEQLVRSRPIEDPDRGEALYALGRVRSRLGLAAEAREALLEGIRTGSCLDRCQDLLGQIDLEQDSITTVPVRWTFDEPTHGFFHPWQFDRRGSIRLEEAAPGNTVLVWSTRVDVRDGDQLVIGFRHPRPAPRRLAFRASSANTDAWVQIVALDDHGRAYASPSTWLPVGRWTTVELVLDDIPPIDPLDPPLDPSTLATVQIRDVSGLEGAPPGPNVLLIDDFEAL